MLLFYSTFKYATIPLGIIFHSPEAGVQTFIYVEDLSRMAKFDNEINLKLVHCLLLGIKEDIESQQNFSIREFTKYYVNEFRFDDEQTVKTDDITHTIEDLKKSILSSVNN